MKIYISGLYSGTNPQPGIGIARSLRAAYPGATLVGVEYSNRCSGIHWTDLDELWLQRPWEELSLEHYAEQVREVLDSGAIWVSSVDLEIMWLASVFPRGHANLLTPPPEALKRIAKPAVEASKGLPVRIPTHISTENSDWALHAFCREHNWRVWLKGPYYEAVRTPTWDAVEIMRTLVARAWSTEKLFLQTHVTGYEESVCFAAHRGELLDSVYMRKRELTEEGKTWAGDITEVPEEFTTPLRRVVRELNWTGGAELEMVRDAAGQLWLLECNPRFPAWIHGATIAGTNLPALLVEAATGRRAERQRAVSDEFTRVVLEVPVRPEFPLPPLPEPFPGAVGHSMKHPSGTLALAAKLHKLGLDGDARHDAKRDGHDGRPNGDGAGHDGNGRAHGNGNAHGNGDARAVATVAAGVGQVVDHGVRVAAGNGNGHGNGGQIKIDDGRADSPSTRPEVPQTFIDDLRDLDADSLETPGWLFMERTARSVFAGASRLAARLTTPEVKVTNAYSIKTNPDERLLKIARESGSLGEGISLLEVQKALRAGFRPDQIVLNGPGKWWPAGLLPKEAMHAVFCDSVADLRRVVASVARGEMRSKIVGVRLRTPNVPSRFGIPVDTPAALNTLVEAVEQLPRECSFGVHFHMASSNIGVRQWWHLYESMLRWCRSIETLSGRRVECLDVGGGWFPDDWHTESSDQFAAAVSRARKFLPAVEQVISEPGKAMAQPSMALAMRLLEFEESGKGEIKEAVVDGSIAELPMHFFQPHRILHKDSQTGEWRALRRGKTNLLGRLCMEHDVVAWNVELPKGARVGDVLVFCDAGAYDRSMSYVFGRG
ncbi:MAG: ATP-grasp domain-containing protein [Acidobacteriota bacterium]|nr:ATP-grasp domain-containing protein [Acidobacteriota bacterium]